MNEKNKRLKAALILNAVIVVLECIGVGKAVLNEGSSLFLYYTEDSNLVNLCMCVVFLIFGFKAYRNGTEVPHTVKVLRYVGTCLVSLTFLVVVLVLAPMFGYVQFLFSGAFVYTHFLCPILSFISLVFLEQQPVLKKKDAVYAVLPTLIYAVIIVYMNIARLTVGPYPFLHVYEQPWYLSILWCVAILGGNYLLARLAVRLNQKMAVKK
ncbi:MAG: hypothetical protein LKF79_03725 [Solobacterium sp.]|jgi:hypothetical protein|nr:hypothetical protein [Solobacterium sp.]